jgi:hypothetical protein
MKRFILLALFAGCALFATGPTAKAKVGPPQTWSVTIENKLTDGTTTMIQSDLFSDPPTDSQPMPYTNGVDGVSISGQNINFWPTTDSGTRNVNFSNGKTYACGAEDPCRDGLPSPSDYKTPPTGLTGTTLQNPHAGGMSATAMENMAIGTSQCGTLYWAVRDSTTGFGWRIPNFHGNLANVPESSYVVTTRDSATQWTVESAHGACPDNPYNVGMVLHDETTSVHGKTTTTTYADGYYYVPFHLTFTLQ